jgi:hypothetical protein
MGCSTRLVKNARKDTRSAQVTGAAVEAPLEQVFAARRVTVHTTRRQYHE